MDKTKALGTERVGKLMWRFFVPAFVGVIANSLYNIVDRIFIGQHVGALALSGIGILFPLMLIIMGFGMLVGVGAGVQVSIRLGEQKREEADRVLGTALFMIVFIASFIVGLVFLIKRPILEAFGATSETLAYANDYLNIVLIGTFFTIPGFSMNNMIRSEGNARVAMISMLISAGANVVLDYLFIVVFDWGVKGAAWATVISMFILLLWVLLYFTKGKGVLKFHLKNMVLDPVIAKGILAIGMAPFAMQISSSVVQGFLNTLLIKHGGDLAVGAMSIVLSVTMMIIMSIVALNMAAQPIVGFNHGARQFLRVKQAVVISIVASTAISVVAWFSIQLWPEPVVRLFNKDNLELSQLTVDGLHAVLLVLPLIGFQVVAGNYFQAVGKAKIAMTLTLLRQVFVLIPLLAVLPRFYGLNGVWYSMPISDTISAAVVVVFMYRELKHINHLIKTHPLEN